MARTKKVSTHPPVPFRRMPVRDPEVRRLAAAHRGGIDCRASLCSALTALGRHDLAAHFATGSGCTDKTCLVTAFLLCPGRFAPVTHGGTESITELQAYLEFHLNGVTFITVSYSGSGDSGSTDDITMDGTSEALARDWDVWTARKCWLWNGHAIKDWNDLMDQLSDGYIPAGFENNEGGRGTITVDIRRGVVTGEHTNYEYGGSDSEDDEDGDSWETVDGYTDSWSRDLLNPEAVSELEPYQQIRDSNVGPGHVALEQRGEQRIPVLSTYGLAYLGPKRARNAAGKEITWAVLGDGRIYDPHGIYAKQHNTDDV